VLGRELEAEPATGRFRRSPFDMSGFALDRSALHIAIDMQRLSAEQTEWFTNEYLGCSGHHLTLPLLRNGPPPSPPLRGGEGF